jgi:hypothetical protein
VLTARRKPRLRVTGSAKRVGNKVRLRISGRLRLPSGVSKAAGCNGKVKVKVKRGQKVIATKTLNVRSTCAFAFRGTLTRSKVKQAKKLGLAFSYRGNRVLTPIKKTASLRIRR